jgi:chorismate mutase / prephenate dehydratase
MVSYGHIGFQGEAGAFSDQAARELFGEHIGTRGYLDFDALVRAVDAGEIEFGLLPCENTIYGPIARAYDLLLQYPAVRIVDETSHAIVQCLIGVPGSTLDAIERVLSHPVALEQCGFFLKGRSSLRVEAVDDTAGAVRSIVELGDRHSAAIGPRLAAEMYGGVVLADAIADDDENVTRFLIISRRFAALRGLGRLCVAFSLSHETGSLHKALGGFADENANLRSIVARPKRGAPFEYRFVAEMDWPRDKDAASLHIPGALEVRVLGHY